MGVESSLGGPLYIARSQYERPIEPAALPKELVDLTRHPYAEARVGAVAELSRLLASNNPGMRLSARLTLESMINDDSRKVSDRARAALRERSITGPVAVEAVRQQLASEAEPVPESEPVPGSEQETLPGSERETESESEPQAEPERAHEADPNAGSAHEPNSVAGFCVRTAGGSKSSPAWAWRSARSLR